MKYYVRTNWTIGEYAPFDCTIIYDRDVDSTYYLLDNKEEEGRVKTAYSLDKALRLIELDKNSNPGKEYRHKLEPMVSEGRML